MIETINLLWDCLLRQEIKQEVQSFSHKLAYNWTFFLSQWSQPLLATKESAD